MKWHLDVMSAPMKSALLDLAGNETTGAFFLAGGTAVALHLGHRRSVDLDWFTAEDVGDYALLAGRMQKAIPRFVLGTIAPQMIYCTVRKVRCSFIGLPYPLMGTALELPGFGCRVAGLDDLAAMKLAALAQRGAKKDFIDVFALAREHRPLDDLISIYKKRHGFRDAAHLLNALVYFDDAEHDPMPQMIWKAGWGEVKDSIRAWVKAI